MKPLQRLAFIGNHLPRRCGIATFTHDLHQAVASARPEIETLVVAMTDPGRTYHYPPAVRFEVHDDVVAEYAKAAEFLHSADVDVVSLQHEYGIFGGPAGGHIVELLSRLKAPIITTLHTVLPAPAAVQRAVLERIIEASSRLIVMSAKGHELLQSVHGVAAGKIDIIAHGIPDFPFKEPDQAKMKLGFVGKTVVLTFGLLSPSKGIETVIDAMPAVIAACPNAVYVVLGATHPNLVRDHGEAYRETLTTRVQELGIGNHVAFVDQFVDQKTLLDYISMCDVYVTPYLNEAQMTSGTLAYSFGLGKAVVSTPYWHARELLGDGRGVLVPFGDVKAFGAEIAGLLTNKVRQRGMRERAYAESRSMTWPQSAGRYLASFAAACEPVPPAIAVSKHRQDRARLRPVAIDTVCAPDGGVRQIRHSEQRASLGEARANITFTLPELRLHHFVSLCDGTGILQHSVYAVADRLHGYCVDDNARALLLSSSLHRSGDTQLTDRLTARFAAFIQHAWNPDTGRFRNFMSYDRRWLEETGSEDSHGRTLWALANCAAHDTNSSRRGWAASLFKLALPVVETFTSPRAWAFTLLGLDAYCRANVHDRAADGLRWLLAERLMARFGAARCAGWVWFEDSLAYDNARLSQALIETGLATRSSMFVDTGLQSLRWLMSKQTSPSGCFRPIGTECFGLRHNASGAYDQQPVEAAATISACLAAARADGNWDWAQAAARTFDWFLGKNDLGLPLADSVIGCCCDGLHPDRRNENRGAESVLSFLLGQVEMRQFQLVSVTGRHKSASNFSGGRANHVVTP